MEDTRPEPMVRGQHVYLRASERRDIPSFVRWFNDRDTSSYISVRAPMSEPLEEKWFERMLESQGKTGITS